MTSLATPVVLGDDGPDHVATVEVLLAAGADPTIADRDGVTPLAHAEARGYAEIEALLAARSD
jgi:ankyrin repeat protein